MTGIRAFFLPEEAGRGGCRRPGDGCGYCRAHGQNTRGNVDSCGCLLGGVCVALVDGVEALVEVCGGLSGQFRFCGLCWLFCGRLVFRPAILFEQGALFGSELLGSGHRLRDRFAAGVGGEGEAGGLALVVEHGAARGGEVAGEEGAFAAEFFRCVGGTFDAGFQVGAFLLGVERATCGGEASLAIFAFRWHGLLWC